MLTTSANHAGQLSELLCTTIALVCHREESEVSPETSLVELDMDSLTFVSVLAQIEAVYDIEFAADEILEFLSASTVCELLDMIGRYLQHSKGI